MGSGQTGITARLSVSQETGSNVCSYHSREQALHYLEASEQKGLFVTCGSDFHGKNKPNIVLGGHNALWSDERLPSELKKCSLWKLPVETVK